MPSKKKKYNARFPSGRIKKIMQTDEEVGKVAQAVPVIISRTLELFVESLLRKAMQITSARNAKTLTPSHMKQCILSESRFDFLKDLVKSLPDATSGESEEGPLPINLSVQSSTNHNAKPENTRFPGNSLRTYTRQSSSATGQLGNGTNANFYMENVEPCASLTPGGTLLVPKVENTDPCESYDSEGTLILPKVEPASTSSDEDYEDTPMDYKTTPVSEYVLPSSRVTVDEDYDT